ncbi:hypothetical protein Taro_042607 [Colocasia esculenta]|uniref:Uncharacterized protein n=1 Tax=Colocasia esculenta TaxID=4460 RepID=A0A843WPC7_COLES|nr:hypothetical protein [Colocasia esculenta]
MCEQILVFFLFDMTNTRRSKILDFFFLLFPWPLRAAGLIGFGALRRWGTMLSLSHSLMERVANARAERGDLSGAARARAMANKLQLLGGGGGGIWSMFWGYGRNYAWREGFSLDNARSAAEIYRVASKLVSALQEMGQKRSDAERARWVARNYTKVLSAANTILRRLAQAFSRSGALREAVLMFQKEVAEGELLWDCLQVGAEDLEGLLHIARDLFFAYSTASSASPAREYELRCRL